MLGFTWFSLIDQMDWDTALRENAGQVHTAGLFDFDRNLRAAGRQYEQIVSQWSEYFSVATTEMLEPIAA